MEDGQVEDAPWGELELLREGLRAAGVGAWTWDVKSDVVRWSDNVAGIFGVDPDSFSGSYEAYLDLLSSEVRTQVTEAVGRCLSGEANDYLLEHSLQPPNAELRWLECRGRVWRTADGKPARMAGTVVDISARKQAEQSFLREQALRVAVLSAGAVGIVVTDAAGKVMLANRRAEVLLGARAGALTSSHVQAICPQDLEFSERLAELLTRTTEERTPRFNQRIERGIGKKRQRLSLNLAPLLAGDGVSNMVIAIDDHTELHEAENERKELREQLDHAHRLESVGRLAGGVAHDFNNLLTVILSYCDFAMRKAPVEGLIATSFHEISEAARKAAELTSQLLIFARRQVLEPHHEDIGKLVHELSELLSRTAGDDIQLRISTPPEPAVAYVDRGPLEQVLINLVANARDAMPHGGAIRLVVAPTGSASGDSASEAEVRISVIDEGSGMDAETQQRAFEPFFTTKPRGAGTGLGLASAHGFVRQAGGSITIESELGRGTRVEIALPRSFAPPQERRLSDSLPPPGRGTVLVVEDTDLVRVVAVRTLRDHGYHVLEARDGHEALAVAAKHDDIDVAVIDIMMPGMTGLELGDQLQVVRDTLPVLFVSGYADEQLAQGSNLGNRRFLQKPYSPVTLVRAVRETLELSNN